MGEAVLLKPKRHVVAYCTLLLMCCLVMGGVLFGCAQNSKAATVEGLWYQDMGYEGYSATLEVKNGSYELIYYQHSNFDYLTEPGEPDDVKETSRSDGEAVVLDSTTCELGGYAFSLSPDGTKLVCDRSLGITLEGPWYPSKEEAMSNPTH